MKKLSLLIMLNLAICLTIEHSLYAAAAPAVPLLTRYQLPKPTADELINEINKTKALLPGNFIEALTINADNNILIVGDLHGSSDELIATINKMRTDRYFRADNPWKLQDNCYLIFTGDYEDRGPEGLGVWRIVMNLVQQNPEHVILLRGNHETRSIASSFGFRAEIYNAYPHDTDQPIFKSFVELFEELPNALFLGIRQPDNTVRFGIYCHGGLEPRIAPDSIKNLIAESIRQSKLIGKQLNEVKTETIDLHDFKLENNGFMWSDFSSATPKSPTTYEWNPRGAGYQIYQSQVPAILRSYSTPEATVDYIVRAHQHMGPCISLLKAAKHPEPGTMLHTEFLEQISEWEALSFEQLIKPYSVFTFMCLKPGVAGIDNTQAGFGLIKSDRNNQLTIEPRIVRYFSKK